MAELRECRVLVDKRGNGWISEDQIAKAGYNDFRQIDLIKVDGEQYYDVVGYSEKRKAFWVKEIQLDGAADSLEEEVGAYVERLGDSEPE